MTHSILVTRPVADNKPLVERLHNSGFNPLSCPLLEIRPRSVGLDLSETDIVAVTSKNGAKLAREALADFRGRIFAVGISTAEALKAKHADIVVADGNVDSLFELMNERLSGETERILHLAGNPTRGRLVERLNEAGLKAQRITLYDAVAISQFPRDVAQALQAGGIAASLFFSKRSAMTFVHCVEQLVPRPDLSTMTAIALTDTIKSSLECLYFQSVAVAEHASEESVVKKLIECLR